MGAISNLSAWIYHTWYTLSLILWKSVASFTYDRFTWCTIIGCPQPRLTLAKFPDTASTRNNVTCFLVDSLAFISHFGWKIEIIFLSFDIFGHAQRVQALPKSMTKVFDNTDFDTVGPVADPDSCGDDIANRKLSDNAVSLARCIEVSQKFWGHTELPNMAPVRNWLSPSHGWEVDLQKATCYA